MNNKQYWNDVYMRDTVFSPISEILLDKLIDEYQLHGSALDVGCGRGQLMAQLGKRGFAVTGIDLTDYSADIVGDFIKHDFDQRFDVVFANKVLAFNKPYRNFLDKASAVLKPAGKMVIFTPVVLNDYKKLVSDRFKSIAIGEDDLAGLGEVAHTQYLGDYGVEVVIVK